MGTTTITAKTTNGKTATCKVTVKRSSVSVHDPSIVKGDDGYYYVFGSHMAWARSKTLTGWTTFTNNINTNSTNTGSIFASYWNNWAKYNKNGDANKDNSDTDIALNGNEWAPDVIYNKAMKKWCMYMSVNGPDNNSVIVLCTADSLTGTWTNVGAVVYSGFTNRDGVAGHNLSYTDYTKVTGETTVASRYLSGSSWNLYYGTNAIDPCVKYDENGDLWMSYGSWFGGIYMIKLDETTGLRDYNYTYDYDKDDSDGTTSDPYMGIRVAGGNRASGEASYIIEKDGYYYMFLSYGGLVASGGYNMRVFRSKNITGPYTDKAGYSALRTDTNGAGNTLGNIGIRLMAGYKWSCNTKGYLAQGHNSALVDDDGKMYLVFHTRTDDGTEGHYVKTHQMYMSEDGWLCVAPYEYNGETISETGYSNSDIIGTYEYLVQNPSQKNGTCATTTTITLGADGSIGGLDAAGTWSVKNGTYYATFVINGVTYQGVFAKGYREDTDKTEVMTFTAVGDNNVCIWGSKTTVTDLKTAQSSDETALTLATSVEDDFYLPTYGGNGSTITWKSSDSNVIKIDGRKAVVNRRLTDTKATLTATIKNGTYSSTKEFTVTVKKYDVSVDSVITTDSISMPTKIGNATVEWTSSDESVISTTGVVAKVINDTQVTLTATLKLDGDTDVVKTFDVTVEGIVIDVAAIIKTSFVSLPTEAEGYSITWKSSDETVINPSTGAVTKPASEKVVVTLTAVIGDAQVEREITVAVLPEEFSDYVYSQDYEAVDTVTDVFASTNMSGGISIGTEDSNSYLQFTQDSQASGNRGGMGNFNEAVQSLEEYVVEFDLAIRSGNVADRSQSQFVLTGTDTTTTVGNNNGTSAGYILKLSTGPSSTTWTINDSAETVEIPADTWVHVTAVVSTKNQSVQLEITQDSNVLYKGTTAVNGTGFLQGMYILSGRGNGVTKVDNIKVY
jgi:arabinan endo-1,5-alpha-L-arabinosidase